MRDINECLGLPLIALDTSDELGVVTHFITDPVEGRVIGLASSSPPWFSERKALLFGDVQAFGVDAIIVKTAASVRPISNVSEIQSFLDDPHEKRIRRAVSNDGRNLGTLIDWSFEEQNAEVVRYRLEPPNGGEAVWVHHTNFIRSGKAVVILQTDGNLPPAGPAPSQGGNPATASGGGGASGTWGGSTSSAPAATAERGGTSVLAEAAPIAPAVEPAPVSAPPITPPPPIMVASPSTLTPPPVQETAMSYAAPPVAETPYQAPEAAPITVSAPNLAELARVDTLPASNPALETPLASEPPTMYASSATPTAAEAPVAAPAATFFTEPTPVPAPPPVVETQPVYQSQSTAPVQPTLTPPVVETAPLYVAPAPTTLEAPTQELPAYESAPATTYETAPPALHEQEEVLPAAPALDKPVAEQLKDAINRNEELMVPLVVDKYSDRDILDEQGNWIVHRGQKITSEVAQIARRSWKLYDLWIAAQSMPPSEG